jgi:hypothetical protein
MSRNSDKKSRQKSNSWLTRKIVRAQSLTEGYANKVVDRFAKRDLHGQCQIYLATVGPARLMGNAKSTFLEGLKGDYARDSNGGTVSIEDWCKIGYAEPLFEKILKKLKITHEELESSLKVKTE